MDLMSTGLGRDLLRALDRIADANVGRRVDNYMWTKRDEIALSYWMQPEVDVSVEKAYELADRFLTHRKILLDAEAAVRRGEPAAP